jgi:hypothetical protein
MNACASATVGAVLAFLADDTLEEGDDGFLAAVCASAVQAASRTTMAEIRATAL